MYQRYQKVSIPNPRLHLVRERGERRGKGYPDPWEKVPEKEGRPGRGLPRPEERRTAAAEVAPRVGLEMGR
jgi:hypothetical protein